MTFKKFNEIDYNQRSSIDIKSISNIFNNLEDGEDFLNKYKIVDYVDYSELIVHDGQKIIASIQYSPLEDGVKIKFSSVISGHQKHGIATAMYEYLGNKYGAVISDETLNKYSLMLWNSLLDKHPNSIYSINNGNKTLVKDTYLSSEDLQNINNLAFIPSKKINETPVYNDVNKSLGLKDKDTKDIEYKTLNDYFKKGKLLKKEKIGELTFYLFSFDSDFMSAYILTETKKIISHVSMFNKSGYPFPVVSYSFTREESRGKGLGLQLYEWAINHFGGLVSDTSLTGSDGKGSTKIWEKLSRKYYAYLVSYDSKSKIFDHEDIEEITPKYMGSPYERYMVTVKPYKKDLKESPVFDDSNMSLGAGTLDKKNQNYEYTVSQKDGSLINTHRFNEYIIEIYEINNSNLPDYFIFVLDGEHVVGLLSLYKPTEFMFPEVELVKVHHKHQNKKIGYHLYETAIEQFGGITSGANLTGMYGPGSINIWKKLSMNYNVYVVTETKSGLHYQEMDVIDNKDVKSQSQRFMATDDPINV